MQGTKQPRVKQPDTICRANSRLRAGVEEANLQNDGPQPPCNAPAPPQAGHKRRRSAARPCPSRPTAAALLRPLQVCPRTPHLLPLPPGEALLCAAHAPPQAGHRLRRPAAPPRPRLPRPSPLAPAHAGAHELAQTGTRRAPDRGIAPGADRKNLLEAAFPPMCSGARTTSVRWRPLSSPPSRVTVLSPSLSHCPIPWATVGTMAVGGENTC